MCQHVTNSFLHYCRTFVVINDRRKPLAKTRNVCACELCVCVCCELLSIFLCSLSVRFCVHFWVYPCQTKMLWLKTVGAAYSITVTIKKRRPFEFGRSWKFIGCSYLRLLFSLILSYHMFVFEVFSIAIITIHYCYKKHKQKNLREKVINGLCSRSIHSYLYSPETCVFEKFIEMISLLREGGAIK